MSDALLPFYDRELKALRGLAAEFAEANPQIAGRLRLSADRAEDPHVERLLEGIAFLAARVQHRLDDEFPELTDALLGILYPHYLAPVPSCAVAQFTGRSEMTQPAAIPAGLPLDTEPVRGETCRFRTAYPVTLWPVVIESVRLSGLPLTAPVHPAAKGAAGVLRIALRCAATDATFAKLEVDRLRLYLRSASALPLYELLCAHTIGIALADGPADPTPVLLPPGAIQPVGFSPEEALIPWPTRSFEGFRLLSEYFAFPEKFLFLDIDRLRAKTLMSGGNRMDVFIYLDRSDPELERSVGADALALGCTPIVNLFPQRCEPVPLTHTGIEYRVEPNVRRPGALEVWSIERVAETRPDGTLRPWRPFYRLTAGDLEAADAVGFYNVTRRASAAPLTGSDVLLAPHDPAFDVNAPADAVLSIDALCTNRDLPLELPFGGDHPRLRLVEGVAAVARLACLSKPSATLRAPLREKGFWRLASHLSLSHLSVVGGEAGAAALKEVLRLYDLRASVETRASIEGLISVTTQAGTARVPGDRFGSFCRGLDVTLEFDQRSWQASGLYLLASVLERFLALHATVNSFVRTKALLRGASDFAAAWPARAGGRVLL
jgi:type VI secretion system protein ImpG